MKHLFTCFLIVFCVHFSNAQDYWNSQYGATNSTKKENTENVENTTGSEDPNYSWSWKTGIPTAPPPPPTPVPIDGGVGFLLAAGGLWGIKNLRRKRKQ